MKKNIFEFLPGCEIYSISRRHFLVSRWYSQQRIFESCGGSDIYNPLLSHIEGATYLPVVCLSAGMEYEGRFRKGFFLFLFVTMYIIPSAVIFSTCVRIAIALGRPASSILNRSSAAYKGEDNKRKVMQFPLQWRCPVFRLMIFMTTICLMTLWISEADRSIVNRQQLKFFIK